MNQPPTSHGQKCTDCSIYTDRDTCNQHLCDWAGDSNSGTCSCDDKNFDCSSQCTNFTDKETCHKNNCGWNASGNGGLGVCTGAPTWCPQK